MSQRQRNLVFSFKFVAQACSSHIAIGWGGIFPEIGSDFLLEISFKLERFEKKNIVNSHVDKFSDVTLGKIQHH